MRTIIIGTRGSELALWQANYTKSLLEQKGFSAELKIISTQGDRTQQWNTSFEKLEGKGFFTKELEEALLNKEIDVAVHSHKDLPTESPEGLMIAGVSDREDPSELLLIRKESVNEKQKFNLKKNAVLGTSSARRKAQFKAFRQDVEMRDLRGNVPTRINKLREKQYDAIMLAAAGVERLKINLDEFHAEILDPRELVPAPAQGVLAWQIRENDAEMEKVFAQLNNEDILLQISLERKVLNLFDGGCQLPLGAWCETEMNDEDRKVFRLWVSKAAGWDKQPVQLVFETFFPGDLPEKVVEHINGIQKQNVFVTKNFRDHHYLPNALRQLGFTVSGQSLIELKEIAIAEIPACDWIFFSSKNAVDFFFKQNPKVPDVKFGCISKQTAMELRQYNKRADFIGQSTDTKLIGKQFSALAGNAKVVFPIAKESMQSVQNQLTKKENAINLPVYQTLKHAVTVSDDTNILVFTSPSNVDAFFEKNKWKPGFKAVAMGDATGRALERKGVKKYELPKSFDDLGLLRAVLMLS
ncbi:MAG: porphobilinogen deaminase [Bacteroidetes bacterium]|jgi:hydroxymethylbilane synthase|nr:porphobilinogen deaminase [Bacteroidota bacterium]